MYEIARGNRLPHAPPIRCAQCGSEHCLHAKPGAAAAVTRAGVEAWRVALPAGAAGGR